MSLKWAVDADSHVLEFVRRCASSGCHPAPCCIHWYYIGPASALDLWSWAVGGWILSAGWFVSLTLCHSRMGGYGDRIPSPV